MMPTENSNISTDGKIQLFEMFSGQIANIVQVRTSMLLGDIISLQVALVT
jgi:hypothetical protein